MKTYTHRDKSAENKNKNKRAKNKKAKIFKLAKLARDLGWAGSRQ